MRSDALLGSDIAPQPLRAASRALGPLPGASQALGEWAALMMLREPGEDDQTSLERFGLPDEWELPLRPLCPIPPNAYLRWVWSIIPGARGAPWSLATYTMAINHGAKLTGGAPFREAEAREILGGIAKSTRRWQMVSRLQNRYAAARAGGAR